MDCEKVVPYSRCASAEYPVCENLIENVDESSRQRLLPTLDPNQMDIRLVY